MNKQTDSGYRTTRYYRLGALERAIAELKRRVTMPQNYGMESYSLRPTEIMMLLEAARLGAAEFYKHPELLDAIPPYPFP